MLQVGSFDCVHYQSSRLSFLYAFKVGLYPAWIMDLLLDCGICLPSQMIMQVSRQLNDYEHLTLFYEKDKLIKYRISGLYKFCTFKDMYNYFKLQS